MDKYDIGIVGAGVAGAFAALRVAEKYPQAKIILFDLGRPPGKRRRQLEGFLGCFPTGDGKLYTGDLDKILEIVDGRKARYANAWVTEYFKSAGPLKVIKDRVPNASVQKKIIESGFEIKLNDYIQWKPENVHNLSKLISDKLEDFKNISFSFDNEVHKILKKRGNFILTTSNGDFSCNKVILSVGRSGWRWATNLYKDLGLTVNDDIAKIGIRLELGSQYLKDFNKSHCSLLKEGVEIGPFSWNGTVIPEDHSDLVISSFRSNEDRWKSDKVSFSLFYSKYFQDQGVYQADRLGKLSFLLFNDRVSKEKIRSFIKNDSQLCLLPEYSWLHEVLREINDFIPNLCTKGFFHIPDICTLPSQVNLTAGLESEMEGLYIAGESAGVKGIMAAALMGTIAADNACK